MPRKKNRKREERHAESFGRRCSGVESERGQASINRDIISVGIQREEGDIHHHCQQGRHIKCRAAYPLKLPLFRVLKVRDNVQSKWMDESIDGWMNLSMDGLI